ncbi:MAG: carbohydrate-binding protein [Eubacterium sp.]|nr:carbohydrate-binding protein [Eubacterium sp.]
MQSELQICDKDGNIKASGSGEEVCLVYEGCYEQGDTIRIHPKDVPGNYLLQLDDVGGTAIVYLTGDVTYELPFGEKRTNLSPRMFAGELHLLTLKKYPDYLQNGYRNLAKNVWDQHGLTNCYPHAVANVETRGEAVFAAQNAIDGVTANAGHGEWPYASWGINRQDDAMITIDFGREVLVDRLVMYTRADFPHDNWWTKVSFTFSDGSELEWEMEKQTLPHELTFEPKCITSLTMHDMKKADDPSPFPALTQLEVYGTEQK